MLRVFETEAVGYLRDGFPGGKPVFRHLDNEASNMVARRISRSLFYHISEIVGRHAQFVGAVLDGRHTECQLELVFEIVAEQPVEADEYVRVFYLPGHELAVVESPAEIQYQLYVADNDGILKFVMFALQFRFYLPHQGNKDFLFLVCHVQGLVDAVIEE